MKPAIEIQNLDKEYALTVPQPYAALRDVITGSLKNVFSSPKKKEKFFALRGLNLTLQPGERLGIIGRNGAGKSTLLKILSRITPPTHGQAVIRGRVGSLLEVGTGFHPELTGRENIYLNGSILGLKKAEITRQFDTIIDFSGVEKFIDTPLKHYSTGMQLRLAFSVAAHLEPEILLVDEVLAVGDLEFQKKCIGKMEEVSQRDGRTILFVSHNMDSIRKFCPRSILLHEGRMVADGNTEQVIGTYAGEHLKTNASVHFSPPAVSPRNEVKLIGAGLHGTDRQQRSRYDTTEPVGITLEYEVLQEGAVFTHGINLYNQENVTVFNSHDVVSPLRLQKRERGTYRATAWIPGNLLPEGIFTVGVALFNPHPLDVLVHYKEVLAFEMYTDFDKPNARGSYPDEFPGIIRPLIQWDTQKIIS